MKKRVMMCPVPSCLSRGTGRDGFFQRTTGLQPPCSQALPDTFVILLALSAASEAFSVTAEALSAASEALLAATEALSAASGALSAAFEALQGA